MDKECCYNDCPLCNQLMEFDQKICDDCALDWDELEKEVDDYIKENEH